MANTGLRPDEARRLEYRDVKVVQDGGETILEIEVASAASAIVRAPPGLCARSSGCGPEILPSRPIPSSRRRTTK
jgi:hypothetical protein